MPLEPGTKLGSYEILTSIDGGGTGETYKASDTRLNRFVVIKVLPPHFFENPEMKQRLEREAQMLASLKHPNNIRVVGSSVQPGGPHVLFGINNPSPFQHATAFHRYTVSAGGQRFLIPQLASGLNVSGGLAETIATLADQGGTIASAGNAITVVLNWPQNAEAEVDTLHPVPMPWIR